MKLFRAKSLLLHGQALLFTWIPQHSRLTMTSLEHFGSHLFSAYPTKRSFDRSNVIRNGKSVPRIGQTFCGTQGLWLGHSALLTSQRQGPSRHPLARSSQALTMPSERAGTTTVANRKKRGSRTNLKRRSSKNRRNLTSFH